MKSFNNYVVDTNILKNNAINVKNYIGKNKMLCAVVKANAYGMGLHTVCNALKGIADFFACACLNEAMSIRSFDKETRVLILGHIDNNYLDLVAKNNISISVGSVDQLNEISYKAKSKINIHLQINTGLNRFGIRTINQLKSALKIISLHDNIHLEGVYSHFATKENDVEFINRQYLRFLQFKKHIKNNGVIFHIANSYATTKSNMYNLDMVRCGFLMYGYAKNSIENKPIASITSQIININYAKRGDTVGYDRTYKVARSTKIGIVPVGYADGLNRYLSNKFYVLIKGKKYKIIGLICMDVFMVDLRDDDVSVGDRVVLLGKSGGLEITLHDYAKEIKTSPYEIICNFNYKRMNYVVK